MRFLLRRLLIGVTFMGLASVSAAEPEAALDARFVPYSTDSDHPWNKLHLALFVRELSGRRLVHKTDPLLYRGGTFLFAGESHRQAVMALDQFLAKPADPPSQHPLKRLFLQRDLWAAFDYAAWYPDDRVLKSEYEPGAVAIRNRVAKAIALLRLSEPEVAALPDNYSLAVKSREYAADYDREHPERPFLPADLFDPIGPWVRFHETSFGAKPMTAKHFDGAGGRAVHIVFLRLPGGRAATEEYLKNLTPEPPLLEHVHRLSAKQFPEGTMVAMVRRALAIDQMTKVRPTPLTELVQIRVYRRIPQASEANFQGDFGEQDVLEFVLDRAKLFAGESGLQAVERDDPAEPHFDRSEMSNPFERANPFAPHMPQLKTCIQCHQGPGIYSLTSMERGLGKDLKGSRVNFRTYTLDVEVNYTVRAKVQQYNWGMLQGMLEAK